MSNWFPLHVHDFNSLLDGLSKPTQIAERIVECGYGGSALTNHGNIAGCASFTVAMNSVCKCGHQKKIHHQGQTCQKGCGCKKYENVPLKPILGNEFYISQQDATIRDKTNGKHSHLVVLAKGPEGWKNLIKATSASNKPEVFYRKPRLDLQKLASFSKDSFITFSGHMGSDMANILFEEPSLAYDANSVSDAKAMLRTDWLARSTDLAGKYKGLFGESNFYMEIQLIDHENLPASVVVAECLRRVAFETKTPCVATADSHYCRKNDAPDQRILLCSALETTLNEVQRKLDNAEEVGLSAFFKSNNYHIPSFDELKDLHTHEELANSLVIAGRCEAIKISGRPMLPVFVPPDGSKPDDHLRQLARDGWRKKISTKVPKEKHPEYAERVKHELEVLTGAGLSSYFLIVADFIRYAKEVLKIKVGKGRGSAAGCLVSYLTNITGVDPIRFGLIFARFYNQGRNSPGRVALPDIDCDFPIKSREAVIQYIRDKYGADKVCQMATFSRMQGRGALKDVLRARERCSFEEMGKITEHIPDEAAISDQLQEMLEETGEASIIQWALENNAEQLKEWAYLDEQGELQGPMAIEFAQAIRLEGTKRSQGKHPSGLIISSEPLADIVPMVYDKSSEQMIVGVDMRDAEEMGLVKFDILGLRTLDCICDAETLIRTGRAPSKLTRPQPKAALAAD